MQPMQPMQAMQMCPQCPKSSSWFKYLVYGFIAYVVISAIVVIVVVILLSLAISKAAKASADAQKNFKPESILTAGGTITIPLTSKTESGTLTIGYDNAIDENGDGVQDEKGIVFTIANTKTAVPAIKGVVGFGTSTVNMDGVNGADGPYNYLFVDGGLSGLTSDQRLMYRNYTDFWFSAIDTKYSSTERLQSFFSGVWSTNAKTQAVININDSLSPPAKHTILAPSLDTAGTANTTGKFTYGSRGDTIPTQVSWFTI